MIFFSRDILLMFCLRIQGLMHSPVFSAFLLLFFLAYSNHVSANITSYRYTNHTKTQISRSPSSPALAITTNGCQNDCSVRLEPILLFRWLPMRITSTHTVETVILHVQNQSHQTRTETIKNTEIDWSDYNTPDFVNADGTHIIVMDGTSVTFPNEHTRFERHPAMTGTLLTTINGTSTCIKPSTSADSDESDYPNLTLPPLPEQFFGNASADAERLRLDSRGWTFALVRQGCVRVQGAIKSSYPDLGLWQCYQKHLAMDSCNFPWRMEGLTTALYLTYTTQLTEMDGRESNVVGHSDEKQFLSPATLPSQAAIASSPIPRPSETLAAPAKPTSMPHYHSDAVNQNASPADHDEASFSANPGSRVHKNPESSDDEGGKSPNRPNPGQASSGLSEPGGKKMSRPQGQYSPAEQSQNYASQSTFVVADTTISAHHHNVYMVSSQTLVPDSPLTIGFGPSKTVIRIQNGGDGVANAIVVGSVTSLLPVRTTSPQLQAFSPVVVNDISINVESATNYIWHGQTLVPGSTLTLGSGASATNVALQTGAYGSVKALIVGSSTSPLPTPKPGSPSGITPLISLDGETLKADTAFMYFASGQKLALGSSIILGPADSKKTLELQKIASGTAVVVNGITSLLPMPEGALILPTPPPIVVNGETIIADSASHHTVLGMILAPGSSITIGSGSSIFVIALPTGIGGTTLVVGSSTSLLSAPGSTPPPIVINGQTISADSASQYLISGNVLAPGSSINGRSGPSTTVVALSTGIGGITLIVGSSTSIISAPGPTPPPIVVNGVVISADSASQYIVSGQTLRLGSTINLGGSLTTKVVLQTGVSGTDLGIKSSTLTMEEEAINVNTNASTGGEMSNAGSNSSNGPEVPAQHKKSEATLNANKTSWAWCFLLCLCGMSLIEQVLSV